MVYFSIQKMDLQVKICGITRPEQGQAIALMGATALGFICTPVSPRYVAPEQIAAIVAALPIHPTTGEPLVDRIGVFVDATLEQIGDTLKIGHLNGVQLHGQETPEFCQQLRRTYPQVRIIKALRIRTLEDLKLAQSFSRLIDTVLLDAYHPNLLGGTGKTLDWQALQGFQPDCAWFLSGGLTPDNVLLALQQLAPTGIDLSSGVERSPGDKDLERVKQLFARLRELSPAQG
jgi:phosphoribosylanthranilate isomerase